MVISTALVAVPVGFTDLVRHIRQKALQTLSQTELIHVEIHIRALVEAVVRQRMFSMFIPRVFGGVILQCAITQMTAVAVVRGGLCGAGPVRRPLPSRAINDLAYIIKLCIGGSSKPSQYGQACACGGYSGDEDEPVVAMARLVVAADADTDVEV